jgi:hypothetical protein
MAEAHRSPKQSPCALLSLGLAAKRPSDWVHLDTCITDADCPGTDYGYRDYCDYEVITGRIV